MSLSTYRPLPTELADVQAQMEEHAKNYGLDFFRTIFEVLDYEELSMFAAYGGFPTRYPHWRFGAQYDELMKGYSYGLQKIYEMVINTDPCYAYLLSCNSLTDQKLVIAHVYGHCDFFKNNAWFAHTNRKMLDQMANHAARVRRYIDRYGHEKVEEFVDACLSLEDLIDMHAPHIQRHASRNKTLVPKELKPGPESPQTPDENAGEFDPDFDEDAPHATKFEAKNYLDPYINPRSALQAETEDLRHRAEDAKSRKSFPEEPQRDVLQFLLEHAPLQPWQHDVLSIIRDEAYYFAPQGQTKIMNEGWASFWHSTIMTHHGVTDADIIDYADHHSGTMATSGNRLNPYKLGIELLKDIEDRWNKGQFGAEWDDCDDLRAKLKWDRQLGLGRAKIFEVRRIHNDVTFIDNYLTPEFCVRQNLFQFRFNEQTDYYEIASREFAAIKQQLLNSLTNHGRPFIYVVDGNYRNRGELFLSHRYQGVELKQDYAQDTLVNLEKLWGVRFTLKQWWTTFRRSCPMTDIITNRKRNLPHKKGGAIMSLTDQLLLILGGMSGYQGPQPQTISVSEPTDVTLELDVSHADRLSCSFRELRLSVQAFRKTNAASLKQWADDICQHVTYLMEQLGALEIDPTTGTAQVRSMPPNKQADQTRYYEIFLKTPGNLALRRYRAIVGSGREQIDLQATHELLQRLIPDLVQTAQRV